METESLAKIAIRGKGSVKEGKGKSDAAHASNQDEDLHCLIMADTEEKVEKAKKLIHNVIETVSLLHGATRNFQPNLSQAASIPEGQNELKRNQLRELAALNGTLRDDENQACQNCGEIGHRKYDCPQAKNYTANIICRVCGNAGHMARDCPDRARGQDWRNDGPPRRAIGGADDEYEKLMNELGGGSARDPAKQIGWEGGQGDANGQGQDNVRPWQRGPTGAPAPWEQRQSNPAPWHNPGRGGGHDGGYGGGHNSGPPSGNLPPWQQSRGGGGPAPWQSNGHSGGGGGGYGDSYNRGGGYGGGGYPQGNGYGGGSGGYGGQAPWQQQQQQYAPPPPPPEDDVPPPPPGDVPPPPPPQ